jgi:hypothetical protein
MYCDRPYWHKSQRTERHKGIEHIGKESYAYWYVSSRKVPEPSPARAKYPDMGAITELCVKFEVLDVCNGEATRNAPTANHLVLLPSSLSKRGRSCSTKRRTQTEVTLMHELKRKVEAKLKCTEYYLAYTAFAVSEQLRS